MYGGMDAWVNDGWMDAWINGWGGGQMDGQMMNGRWMDR